MNSFRSHTKYDTPREKGDKTITSFLQIESRLRPSGLIHTPCEIFWSSSVFIVQIASIAMIESIDEDIEQSRAELATFCSVLSRIAENPVEGVGAKRLPSTVSVSESASFEKGSSMYTSKPMVDDGAVMGNHELMREAASNEALLPCCSIVRNRQR